MHLTLPWQDSDNSREIEAEKLPPVIPTMQMISLVLSNDLESLIQVAIWSKYESRIPGGSW